MIDTHIAAFRSAQTNLCHNNRYTAADKQVIFKFAEDVITALKRENVEEAKRLIEAGIKKSQHTTLYVINETCKVLGVPTRDYLFKTAKVLL